MGPSAERKLTAWKRPSSPQKTTIYTWRLFCFQQLKFLWNHQHDSKSGAGFHCSLASADGHSSFWNPAVASEGAASCIPVSSSESSQFLLSRKRGWRVIQDPLYLILNLPGGQQPARPVHPQAEIAPLVVNCHKLAVQPVLKHICGREKGGATVNHIVCNQFKQRHYFKI